MWGATLPFIQIKGIRMMRCSVVESPEGMKTNVYVRRQTCLRCICEAVGSSTIKTLFVGRLWGLVGRRLRSLVINTFGLTSFPAHMGLKHIMQTHASLNTWAQKKPDISISRGENHSSVLQGPCDLLSLWSLGDGWGDGEMKAEER